MSKITNDGLTQSGAGFFIALRYPYGNSGRQQVKLTPVTVDVLPVTGIGLCFCACRARLSWKSCIWTTVTWVLTTWMISHGNNKYIIMSLFIVLSSRHSLCESSLGSCDECRHCAKHLPTIRPSQPTCAVSPPVGCHHLHSPSPFIIITQTEGWYSFYHPTEGRRLSRPRWLVPRWFTHPPTITLPSTNRARRRVTTLIEANMLPLSHCSNL